MILAGECVHALTRAIGLTKGTTQWRFVLCGVHSVKDIRPTSFVVCVFGSKLLELWGVLFTFELGDGICHAGVLRDRKILLRIRLVGDVIVQRDDVCVAGSVSLTSAVMSHVPIKDSRGERIGTITSCAH